MIRVSVVGAKGRMGSHVVAAVEGAADMHRYTGRGTRRTHAYNRKACIMIRVSVVGAKGRMGSHVVAAVEGAADMQLALALDAGDDLTAITPDNTDVVVEFTVPSVALGNVLALVKQGVNVVVGTTGWTEDKLNQVSAALTEAGNPDQSVFIAPNFAISAVLADHFARVAAPYAVEGAADMQLALALDAGDDLTAITPDNTDVVVEFTVPSVALGNVLALVKQGVNVVVGTTGWTEDKLNQVSAALTEAGNPDQSVFIAPNFAISAVLADHFARVAAPYFESAEVVELHHPNKVDAPSGTAIHTAQGIAEARAAAGLGPVPDATDPPRSWNCTTRTRWTRRAAPRSTPRRASPRRAPRPVWARCPTRLRPTVARVARSSTACMCTRCACAVSTRTRRCSSAMPASSSRSAPTASTASRSCPACCSPCAMWRAPATRA